MSAHNEAPSNHLNASTARSDLPADTGLRRALPFPVVGVGASAGGLDAFKTLLAALPSETGMAFVLIQHLDPKHASFMADLLASRTRMPVSQAVDGVSIEPNHVYLIPPAVSLAVSDGKLHLAEPAERHGARMPFDFFLRSLAKDCGQRAICVVLSGTGSDGSEGVKAIKDQGGFVIVQDPHDAQFDGMPKKRNRYGRGRCDSPSPGNLESPCQTLNLPSCLGDEICRKRKRCEPACRNPRPRQSKDGTRFQGLQGRHANPSDRAPHGGCGHLGRRPLCR